MGQAVCSHSPRVASAARISQVAPAGQSGESPENKSAHSCCVVRVPHACCSVGPQSTTLGAHTTVASVACAGHPDGSAGSILSLTNSTAETSRRPVTALTAHPTDASCASAAATAAAARARQRAARGSVCRSWARPELEALAELRSASERPAVLAAGVGRRAGSVHPRVALTVRASASGRAAQCPAAPTDPRRVGSTSGSVLKTAASGNLRRHDSSQVQWPAASVRGAVLTDSAGPRWVPCCRGPACGAATVPSVVL